MDKKQKYIICNSARGDWGKTDTLLEVITVLSPFRTTERNPIDKD